MLGYHFRGLENGGRLLRVLYRRISQGGRFEGS